MKLACALFINYGSSVMNWDPRIFIKSSPGRTLTNFLKKNLRTV
jgi:hypothetical protein